MDHAALTDRQWLVVSLGLVMALGMANVAIGSTNFSGVLIIGPLVASTQLSTRRTAFVALTTVGVAAATAAFAREAADAGTVLRQAGVASASAFAVAAATWREQRERRLVRLARLADVAQSAILRPLPERLGAVRLASRYVSASEEAVIGGDFYEAVETPWGLRLLIGDVKGKGLAAVRTASRVLGGFRLAALQFEPLEPVAQALAECAASELGDEDFVTALVVQVEPDGSLTTLNCGHHPLIVVDGEARLLPDVGSPALGLDGDLVVRHWRPAPRRIVLYTDGLVEARAPDGSFVDTADILRDVTESKDVEDCVERLLRRVEAHTGGRQSDDVAVVAVDVSALIERPPDAPMRVAGASQVVG